MKRAFKAIIKAAEVFDKRLEAIGAGFCSSANEFNKANKELARQINNALAALKTEKQKEKERVKFLESLSDHERAFARRLAKVIIKLNKRQAETYNLKNLNENMKKLREAKH